MATQELEVKLGSQFVIELPSNRTTGYGWEAHYDETLLELSASKYECSSERPGSGGTESFIFKASREGRALIRMLYKRPWEETTAREILYEVTIKG
jgi:inhibitor of cysteine peptidase